MKIHLLLLAVAILLPNESFEKRLAKWEWKLNRLCEKKTNGLVIISDVKYVVPFNNIMKSCPPMVGMQRKIYTDEEKAEYQVHCDKEVLDLCRKVNKERRTKNMKWDLKKRFQALKSTTCPAFSEIYKKVQSKKNKG